jgi:orotidine-5'-phosphate decarboxylase
MAAPRIQHVAVALDTSDWSEFSDWVDRFGPRVGVLKVGLEAFVRWGPRAVERAGESGADVFLDLKLHDIPNTVAGAANSAAGLGVRYLTVHASGGLAMLRAAVEAVAGRAGILAVTLLTHLDRVELDRLSLPGAASQRVLEWARLAATTGCAGTVCSPLEVAGLRAELQRPFTLVTPGIRLQDASAEDDQRRVATPESALAGGSDLLVVGRPVTRADDPESVLDRLAAAGLTR